MAVSAAQEAAFTGATLGGANGQFQPHYFIGDVFGALPLGCVGDCDAVEGVVTGEN